ncbi:PREDICTED: uncharacterized protein LOC101382943 [Odobenus rosmarus divergens]|uniref:Uncharacterized protein LOC101382943 n=1 Tax=Odobenus rosmarus divergens TaxID=9708 RepID=A0A9B0G3P2_ODORO
MEMPPHSVPAEDPHAGIRHSGRAGQDLGRESGPKRAAAAAKPSGAGEGPPGAVPRPASRGRRRGRSGDRALVLGCGKLPRSQPPETPPPPPHLRRGWGRKGGGRKAGGCRGAGCCGGRDREASAAVRSVSRAGLGREGHGRFPLRRRSRAGGGGRRPERG